MGTILFDGQAPYVMPNPQRTYTIVAGDRVEVQIRVLLERHPNELADVVFRLTKSGTLLLAQQLNRSASEIVEGT